MTVQKEKAVYTTQIYIDIVTVKDAVEEVEMPLATKFEVKAAVIVTV